MAFTCTCNGDRHCTLAALEYWMPRWRDLGLEFVTIDETVGRPVKALMDERAFYTEKEEARKIKLICPSCRGEFEAPVRWKVCRKKTSSRAAPAKKTATNLPRPLPLWFASTI